MRAATHWASVLSQSGPGGRESAPPRRLAVGLSRSRSGRAALDCAVALARADPLLVVEAVRIETPLRAGVVPVYGADIPFCLELYREARATERVLLDELLNELARPDVHIPYRTVEGPLVRCLVAAARDADLLIMGSGNTRRSHVVRRCLWWARDRITVVNDDGVVVAGQPVKWVA